jgi:tetratricopeptide (TPR) repeat protein
MKAHLFLCAATSLLACSCSVLRSRAPPSAPRASDFEAAIARIERTDPASPAVLTAQLAYADFLLSAAPGPCADRLVRAQEQLGSAEANPKTRIAFPGGWPRAADLEYRLHLARAACGTEADRKDELRAAVAAARRAVELYRNVFDYRSMVILQFDLSTALHQLGEHAAALAALEVALDMDREYGFRDDAPENYKLLLTWRGEPAGPAQVAALMQDFPKRRTTFSFGWRAGDAQITLESRRECLKDGRVVGSRAAATFERRIGADPGGSWSVSYLHRLSRYEPGVWPTIQGSQPPQMVFPPAMLPAVGFKVSATGQFAGVTDSEAFAARLVAKTQGLIRARAPSGERVPDLTSDAVEMTPDVLSPGALEARTAQNYALETAMWIGATLEQGVWYEISAPLALPGLPRIVVQHRIAFAFTRMVPCTARAAAQACVEIVIHATPDQAALDDLIAELPRSMHYSTSIEARIITDPATLLPYAREERVSWYAAFGADAGLLESEHLTSMTSYGSH